MFSTKKDDSPPDRDFTVADGRQDMAAIKAENAALKQEVQRLKEENSDLSSARSKEQKRFAERIKQLTNEKNAIQESFATEALLYIAARADRTQAQRENAIFKTQAEELSSQVQESVAERDRLRDQVSTLKSDLSNERFARAGEQREHTAALSTLRDTLKIRDAIHDQLIGELESVEDAINDLMAQTKSLFRYNEHLKTSLAKITRDASYLQQELQECKTQLQSAVSNGESPQLHGGHAENDKALESETINALHEAQEDLAATKGELEEKTMYLAEVTTRHMSSQSALVASETKFALLEQTLDETKHMLSFEQSHLEGVIRELEIAYADIDSTNESLKNEQQLHKALQSRFDCYFYRLCYWLEEVENMHLRIATEGVNHSRARANAFCLFKCLSLVFVASRDEFGLSEVELPPLDLNKYPDDFLRVVEKEFLPQQADALDRIRSAMSQTTVADTEAQKEARDDLEDVESDGADSDAE
ncbi:hypothetical protein IWZ01DRAFT_573294 [Phyllosticta capitalensis]